MFLVDLSEEIFEIVVEKVEIDTLFVLFCLDEELSCVLHSEIDFEAGVTKRMDEGEFVSIGTFILGNASKVSEDLHPDEIETFLSVDGDRGGVLLH